MENKRYAISVVVPVYGVEAYVEECLRSVMAQDYDSPVECIIVDDCGSDNSMDVVRRVIAGYTGPITFRILCHQHNRGLSAARNTGMAAATGDYICFLDSDDMLTPDCLSTLVAPLAQHAWQMVIGDIKVTGDDTVRLPLLMEQKGYSDKHVIAESRWTLKYTMVAPNKLYSLRFLRDNGLKFLEGVIHEDELWTCEVALLLDDMYAVRKETYIYNVRPGSIMSGNTHVRRMQAFSRLVEAFADFVATRDLWDSPEANGLFHYLWFVLIHASLKVGGEEYRKHYYAVRDMLPLGPFHFVRMNGLDWRTQKRDLHFLFPRRIGASLCVWINCIGLRGVLRKIKKRIMIWIRL